MIKTNLIAHLETLTDAELWFAFNEANNNTIAKYGAVAALVLQKVENEVKTQLDLVKFMQEFNNRITDFQDALLNELHIIVVMNQRLDRQRKELKDKGI